MIRLAKLLVTANGDNTLFSVDSDTAGRAVAFADSREEAETARLAFERVLLPRFTADEAIAIVLDSPTVARVQRHPHDAPFYLGMRATLEALAAADVFVVEACGGVGSAGPKPCSVCDATGVHQTMADKLDAAGIR